MKKGDRIKFTGDTNENGHPLAERELDDGAVEKAVCVPKSDVDAYELPPDAQYIKTKYEGKGYYRVVSAEPYRHKGPARANTAAFRTGWDTIFGNKKRNTDLN